MPTETWRELLPVAYLLTGSDVAARDLLARGLARGDGLRGLVRTHLRRRFRGEGAIRGTSGAPWWVSPEDAAAATRLAAALDTLTRAERTAVVLRWSAGLPDGEVAELVPGADLGVAAARLSGEVPDPADLPARLDGLAALADTGSLTDSDIELDVGAVRSRRRSRVALAVGAVAVLGVGAVLLPDALPRTQSTAPAPTDQAVEVRVPRGSLVDDGEFLAAARAMFEWAPDEGEVVYAGDLAGARWVLLVRQDPRAPDVAWLAGPAGAPATDLTGTSGSYAGSLPGAWSATVDVAGTSVLLVVAEPDDEIEVSAGFDVAPDGTATRTFQDVDLEDGVATVTLDRPTASGAQFRLVRDDVVGPVDYPWYLGSSPVPPDPVLPDVRSGAELDPTAYHDALWQIGYPTGYREVDLEVTVLGAGSYAAPGGATARAVTIAAVLPGGAVLTSTSWAVEDANSYTGGSCGVRAHPAGTDPASLTVVARCASYAGDGSTFGATVLVSAPPGTAVQLNTAIGGAPQAPTLQDGWGYVIDAADGLTQFSADGVLGTVSREGGGPFDGG